MTHVWSTGNGLYASRAAQVVLAAGAALGTFTVIRYWWWRHRCQDEVTEDNGEAKKVVILHQMPRTAAAISLSPFAIKLETFLKMHQIDYVNEFCPSILIGDQHSAWISVDGKSVTDSQLAFRILADKFDIDIRASYSVEELAVAKALGCLLEDHLYWILMSELYLLDEGRHVARLMRSSDLSPHPWIEHALSDLRRLWLVRQVRHRTVMQGMGRHSRGDLQRMGIEDLQTLSTYLGNKTYVLGGNKPTELDATLFGFIALIINASPNQSVFKTLLQKRLVNLVNHMNHMQQTVFPEWHDLLPNSEAAGSDLQDLSPKSSDEDDQHPATVSTPSDSVTAQIQPESVEAETPSPVESVSLEPLKMDTAVKPKEASPTKRQAMKPEWTTPEAKAATPSTTVAAKPKVKKPTTLLPLGSYSNGKEKRGVTSPTSSLSPLSPTGTSSGFRKSSLSLSKTSLTKGITNGASNVFKNFLGKKK